MSRRLAALWFVMVTLAGVVTYLVTDEVQLRVARLDVLHRDIDENREALRVLRAEWSHLINPSDLEGGLRSHMGLRPTETLQLANFEAIPFHPDATPVAAPDATPVVAPVATPKATPKADIASVPTPKAAPRAIQQATLTVAPSVAPDTSQSASRNADLDAILKVVFKSNTGRDKAEIKR